MKKLKITRNNKEGDVYMRMKVENIIEKYGMDYITVGNLDVLPLEERESSLSRIYRME